MPTFLFMFGFETPRQHRMNKAHNLDDEDSHAVFIECSDPEAALTWGREIAESFVQRLWAVDRGDPSSWKQGQFAHWIESSADEIARARAAGMPCVRIGEHPAL